MREVVAVATLERAREAKAALRDELAGLDGVTGVGIARADLTGAPVRGAGTSGVGDDWLLRVNVTSDDVAVPETVDGVDVEVRVVGDVTASRA
ncbi:hypothetical protein J5A69_14225 [Cellulosimicrobium cellulans]|nr:hypothetical protein [Cellulosimicrobium aquatile]PTU57485.1 hypothetical protein DBB34_03830 [Sphaerisporangium cinnabarinum]QUB98890.1 hypothetical protein J5A69_14225 [Cellulosimicrobium cellulans]